jgi:hypothetical protein
MFGILGEGRGCEEAIEWWRNVQIEELHNLCSWACIAGMIEQAGYERGIWGRREVPDSLRTVFRGVKRYEVVTMVRWQDNF